MKILRTPDSRFHDLVGYPFAPHYTNIRTEDGSELRIHHLDEGPMDGPLVLCLHGQPAWSYLYRKMIPKLTHAGLRVIAPDLPGYGKSDKPAAREDYSYESQVQWMGQWLEQNNLSDITLFGQDWGGLIGLRLVVHHDARFSRVVISNTGLPYNPDVAAEVIQEVEDFRANAPTPTLLSMQRALFNMAGSQATKFAYWQKFCWETERLPIGLIMSMSAERHSKLMRGLKFMLYAAGVSAPLPSALAKAYEAPFPDPSYMMGPRAMPSHVPTLPTSASLEQQRQAWAFFERFRKPLLCAFTDDDPVTAGGAKPFLARVPGTRDLAHTTIRGGGHFVQEKAPDQLSAVIAGFVEST
ncbi:MAG: alpha/beta fold hydrolase [OM182 bacterium]|nr:MAG: alpha/beta fold hydrolase [OM182 bacterium]